MTAEALPLILSVVIALLALFGVVASLLLLVTSFRLG